RPNGDGIQSTAERKSKNVRPNLRRATSAAVRHAPASTRIHRSTPGRRKLPVTASPSSCSNEASSPARSSSTGSVTSVAGASALEPVSTDDNRLSLPTIGHVLVEDALLEQHDALEQRFGPRRAARDVHVHRDDLVDSLGHRVAV